MFSRFLRKSRVPISRSSLLESRTSQHLKYLPSSIDGDRKLYVVFSHVNVPAGKFAQINAFSSVPNHRVFVNVGQNDWYLNGIPGLAKNIKQIVRFFQKLSHHFEITFVGHSMGAYLSLVCGLTVENSRFLSTSPELHLGAQGSRSRDNGVSDSGPWTNIKRLTHLGHGRPNGHIIFGAYDPIDALFLSLAEEFGSIGNILEAPYHHGVTEWLTGNRVYLDLVNSPDSIPGLLEKNLLLPIHTLGNPNQYSDYYQLFLIYQQAGQKSRCLDIVSQHAEWSNAGWQNLRARFLYNQKYLDEARFAALRAVEQGPRILEYRRTLAEIESALNNGAEINELARQLSLAEREHPNGQAIIRLSSLDFDQSE